MARSRRAAALAAALALALPQAAVAGASGTVVGRAASLDRAALAATAPGASASAAGAAVAGASDPAAVAGLSFAVPAPGITLPAASRYRFAWEEPATGSPILGRALSLLIGAPGDGGCASATYRVAWTRPAEGAGTYTVEGLAPGACYELEVWVARADRSLLHATSGTVATAPVQTWPGPAGDFTAPVAGGTTAVPVAGFAVVAWDESASGAPIVERRLDEWVAPAPPSGACASVASWEPGRTFLPAVPRWAVTGLADGTCYRYVAWLTDASGRRVAVTSGPLLARSAPPACAFADEATPRDPSSAWSMVALDTAIGLDPTYAPTDLVDVSTAGLNKGPKVRAVAIADLRAMAAAARKAGAPIAVTSAYRSYAEQALTFWQREARRGLADALAFVARPGHSEHQLGLAIDLTSAGGTSVPAARWDTSKAGRWMEANAWRFGWLRSYPAGAAGLTCYDPEPWHYRYVGRAVAAEVHALGVPLRVYLWTYRSMPAGG